MPRRISIATKFFLTYFVITGVALVFAGTAGYFQFRRYAIEETDRRLLSQARLVAEIFRPMLEAAPPDLGRVAREGDRVGKDLDIRLTVILPDGRVAADPAVGAARVPDMENHATRPEVASALAGNTGVSLRHSITLRDDERYLAVPIRSGERVVGAARASVPVSVLDASLSRIRTTTWGTGLAAFLVMLAGTAIRARAVRGPLDEMRSAARALAAGNLGKRVAIRTGDELEDLGEALNTMAGTLQRTISLLDAEKVRLAALLENLSEGVVVIAPDKTVRMMNHEAARILGTAAPAEAGQRYADAIRHPEVLAFIDGWRSGRAVADREVSVPSRRGELSVLLSGTRVGRGDDADILLNLRDVTAEKRLAKIKSEFVSNASHELRTPLTNVRGYLEAAQDAVAEGGRVDPSFLEIAHANARRMEQLIDDLLELSRAESGEAPPTVEEVPLPEFLRKVASFHGPAAERAARSLSVDAEEVVLAADVRGLFLAVSNLVDNALKYGRERGRVSLTGRAADGGILIEVEDDGPGIAPEHIPRLFERFYRVDKGRSRKLGGTGLGLSIAKHIVESQGGTIAVESRIGEWTRFTIRLPARRPQAEGPS